MRGEVSLGSLLARVETGWSPACDAYPPAVDEWGVIKVSGVTSGNFDPNEAKRLPASLQPRQHLEIQPGDVLVARANGARSLVGAVCQVGPTRRKLMLSDKILRLIPDGNLAESAFLAILLRSAGVRQQIGNLLNGGTGQNNISQMDLRELVVPDVSLTEQRRIIAMHAAFERRIGSVKGVLGKLRVAEQALSTQALTPAQRNEWDRVPLESVATVAAGVTLGSEPVGGGTVVLPYLRVANVLDGRIDTTDLKQVRILSTQYARYALKQGDLLLTEGGDLDKLGRGAVWDSRIEQCLHQNHVFRVRCRERLMPDFLALYTASAAGRAYFQRVGKQTTNLASINSTQVKKMPVPVPPMDEQERLLGPIWAVRKRAEVLGKQITKIRTVQRGIVEDLLAGHSKASDA
ncbi:restriction endonuclease subunit S [Amycolatopsis sp. NPDC049159]|uniref:restriction endonuclease subunit S n=1 Tax=Amycolatopsis sp. NPDC049159 TaxID=3157210 RepID=UPI0033F5EA34